jgi:HAD superfamily hydrolase (TIGR01509 family)
MTIRAILLDADGVVQRAGGAFRTHLATLVEPQQDLDAFIAEVVAVEQPCLIGAADFAVELARILERWNSRRTVAEALAIWRDLIVDRSIIDAVAAVRSAGLCVCLATNQHTQRATYMSDELGYRDVFDREFYSCHVGAAKPDREYFERIVGALGLPPVQLLFFDDHDANVAAAREAGLNAAFFQPNSGAVLLRRLLEGFGVTIT